MKKNRIVSSALAALIALQMMSAGMSASAAVPTAAAAATSTAGDAGVAVPEAVPAGNVLTGGALDTDADRKLWNPNGQMTKLVKTADGGYMECVNLILNYTGFTYIPTETIGAGTYHFVGYLKTKHEGEVSKLRAIFTDNGGSATTVFANVGSTEWTKIDTYITLPTGLKNIKVCGAGSPEYKQFYCMDNFSLVRVDKVPDGVTPQMTFGKEVSAAAAQASTKGSLVPEEDNSYTKWDPVKEAQYEVQGLVINQDADGFISSCANATVTYDNLRDYALGFEGSHVTDYMITLNNTNASFPSETWTDVLDKYHQDEENGQAVNYKNNTIMKGAYNMYEVAGLDYIDIWCDTFPTIGINPWLSFRMNDAHDLNLNTSSLLSDYFHENPGIRRVQHEIKNNSYYANCQDYSHELVRDHMLDLINEALNRYDCYGIELDFQREIWLWYVGGEYLGIDILNDFMREVEDLVAVYEAKYGHDIKIAVRCASDIDTNYDFGLDIPTWAAEGIIDVVIPCGRWTTTDNGTPIKAWDEILEPYGVDLWGGIENNVVTSGQNNTFYTFAATSASYLSQGADKVYLFNYYRGYTTKLTESDRITTTDPDQLSELGISSGRGYWNIITTMGSYDKLMTVDRRLVLTYNDTKQIWVKNSNKQVNNGKYVMSGKSTTLNIPVGDIPEGSVVTIKIGTPDAETQPNNPPTVYVNSELCTYTGIEACVGGITKDKLLCYTVPAAAHDNMYITAEISPKNFTTFTYAEVYIDVPDNAVAPVKAETTPSDWAKSEVDAALDAGLVPMSLRSEYTNKISRREFCTLIMAMLNKASGTEDSRELLTKLGINYVDSFTDTDIEDVVAANLIGIVNGRGNGVFDPNAGITRQEAASMLAKAAGVLGISAGTVPSFADIGTAGSWAVDSINTIASIVSKSGKNVMGGVGNNNFDPLGTYTRQQAVLTVYRLFDSASSNVKLNVSANAAVTAAEKADRISPAEVKPAGVSGTVIRASADEVNVSRLIGTTVTDCVLTIGAKDPTNVINALMNAGINVYISVDADTALSTVTGVLERYNVNGIELDFMAGDAASRAVVDSYGLLYTLSDTVVAVNDTLTAYEAKYGHDIALSVRVASDIYTCYNLGLNVMEWVAEGLVDMVSPSSGSEVTDTDMPIRLWYSLLESYDVTLAPVIGDVIKTNSNVKALAQTPATLAAEASNMLSKGADKVSVSYSVVDDASLKVLGSYEALLAVERRAIPTYTAVKAKWQVDDSQLSITAGDKSGGVIKVALGDVPADKTVTLKLAFEGAADSSVERLIVYANSEKCTYTGKEATVDALTGNTLYCYTVPAEICNNGQLVLEFRTTSGSVVINYAEVSVK